MRYFNASGADPDGEIGELHDPETHLIPLVVMAAMGERADIKIFGTDYSTDDGTAIRDYVHVNDLASAHIKALRLLDEGHESMKLNLGTGCGNSVREVIGAVEAVSGRKVKVIEAPRRAGDPLFWWLTRGLRKRRCLGSAAIVILKISSQRHGTGIQKISISVYDT